MKALQLTSKNYHIVYSKYNKQKEKKEKKVKCCNIPYHHLDSDRICSVVERLTAEREVVGSTSQGRTNTQGLKITEK